MDRLTTALPTSQEVGMSESTTAELAPWKSAAGNAYLSGNFAPMTCETTAFSLKTRGASQRSWKAGSCASAQARSAQWIGLSTIGSRGRALCMACACAAGVRNGIAAASP